MGVGPVSEKLFDENIRAWEHELVVRGEYNHLKKYGTNLVPADIVEAGTVSFDKKLLNFLCAVRYSYGACAPYGLCRMTHEKFS